MQHRSHGGDFYQVRRFLLCLFQKVSVGLEEMVDLSNLELYLRDNFVNQLGVVLLPLPGSVQKRLACPD